MTTKLDSLDLVLENVLTEVPDSLILGLMQQTGADEAQMLQRHANLE